MIARLTWSRLVTRKQSFCPWEERETPLRAGLVYLQEAIKLPEKAPGTYADISGLSTMVESLTQSHFLGDLY